MAKEFSRAFYNSATWKNCKEEYLRSKGYLCERCLKQGKITPAKIVHHKIHLNPNNINNPEVAIGFNNLEALCQDCHNKEHFKGKVERRCKFDEFGRLIVIE